MFTRAILVVCTIALAPPEVAASKPRAKIERHFRENPVFDQSALFGPRKGFDDVNKMDIEVKKNRLLNLVKSHDSNNDDIIEMEELEAWILEAFRIMDFDEAEKEFEGTDTDHNGKVSFEEAVLKRHEVSLAKVKELQEKADEKEALTLEDTEILQRIGDERKMFEAADTDNDGVLDAKEFNRFDQTYNYPDMAKLQLDLAMDFGDIDKDGYISLAEFTREGSNEEQQQETKEKLDELDEDKDGKLSRDELRRWVVPDNHDGTREEAERLMEEADANKDGRLSIEEIVEKQFDFMHSLGTNFGVHLHFVKDEL